MKQLACMLFFLSFTGYVIAQNTDSVIQYRFIESTFTDKSKSTTDSRHYQYVPVRMHAGDQALIEFTSSDFVTALMVRDSLGHEGVKEDDTTMFKALGSKIILPFKAPADGPYYFVFMTRLRNKTGKFKAHIFHYNVHNNHITTASPFCEKLKYIAGSAYTGFEFLKDKEQGGKANSFFSTTVNLLPGGNAQITHDMGDSYACALPPSADLAGLKKKYDELDHTITACLADHKKKVYTIDSVSDIDKKTFVRKTEFSLKGTYSKDLNALHALNGLKDKVTLELDKDNKGKYLLFLSIE